MRRSREWPGLPSVTKRSIEAKRQTSKFKREMREEWETHASPPKRLYRAS